MSQIFTDNHCIYAFNNVSIKVINTCLHVLLHVVSFSCPENCSCNGFSVDCSISSDGHMENKIILPLSPRSLDIRGNLKTLGHLSFSDRYVQFLVYLNMSAIGLRTLTTETFLSMKNLISIDLSMNYISSIPPRCFASQSHLKNFRLVRNLEMLTISSDAFGGLQSVEHLTIANSNLQLISKGAFSLHKLKFLDLSENTIYDIESNAFETLVAENIFLNDTDIDHFTDSLFKGIEKLDFLVTSDFKFCCLRPYFLPEEQCLPAKNEFSSCKDLMRNQVLRSLIWIIGLLAVVGNTGTLIYHFMFNRERLKLGYGIFVSNLAVSDFVMGLYLVIIASADMYYRGNYILHDSTWRNSGWCQFAGVLASLSSETSVFFICLITIDRLLVVRYPFGEVRMRVGPAYKFSIAAWVIGLIIAISPLAFYSYFKGDFYSRSGVCLGLPLTRDRPSGWLYSVMIFIGFNFMTFVLIGIGQWSIFREVAMASKPVAKSVKDRRTELRVARNLLLVALTDFLCWFPIGVLGNYIIYQTLCNTDPKPYTFATHTTK